MVGQNNDHNSFLLINNNAAYGTGAGFDGTLQTTLLDLFNLDGAGLVPASFKSAAQTAALTYAEINSSAAALTDAIDTSGATKNGIYTLTSSYRSAAQTGTVEDVTLRLQHEDGTVYEAVIKDEDTANANDILGTTTKTVKFSNGVEVTFSATELNNLASATQTAWLGGADGNAVRFEVKAGSATSLDFQIGAKSDDLITIDFDSMTGTELGVSGLNIETASNAQAASDSLDTAINKVNSATAEIGALQSRMEYVSSNLATITENLEAANGVFRDVDMAKEMTEFTKNQSLMQAGISMLSQANQMPQLLLRLIQ
jgi:flagellin